MLAQEILAGRGFARKKCPKCRGQTFIGKDIYGWYEKCLQCGRSTDLPRIGVF